MAAAAILVNGNAAADKSLFAVKLAALLGCPVLPVSVLDGQLAALTGPTVPAERLRGVALETVWLLAAEIRDGVVIDGVWTKADREPTSDGVGRAGATKVVEVWCDRGEPSEVEPPESEPLGLWPVVHVDTRTAVDFNVLLPELAAYLLA